MNIEQLSAVRARQANVVIKGIMLYKLNQEVSEFLTGCGNVDTVFC